MRITRKFPMVMVLVILFTTLSMGYASADALRASNMKVGEYIEFGKYNDNPIVWKVLGSDNNGIYLISDKVISIKPFSAKGTIDGHDKMIWSDLEGNTDRDAWGDPRWKNAALRVWLNGEKATVDYVKAKAPAKYKVHGATVKPKDGSRMFGAFNAYDEEAGFLSNFEGYEINVIASVEHKVLLADFDKDSADGGTRVGELIGYNFIYEKYDNVYYEMVEDKVFCPSTEEIKDLMHSKGISALAYPTPQAYELDESKDNNLRTVNDPAPYWLRTPETSGLTITKVLVVDKTISEGSPIDYGIMSVDPAVSVNKKSTQTGSLTNKSIGVRPALYLKKDTLITGKGTMEDLYKVKSSQMYIENKNTGSGNDALVLDTASSWSRTELTDAFNGGLTTDRITDNFVTNITREEFCEVVMKFYDKLGGKPITNTSNPFSDTTNPEVIRAYNAKIVGGTSETTFTPNNNLARQELCVMLIRALNAAGSSYSTNVEYQQSYSDKGDIAGWAVDGVRILNGNKIFNGTGKGLDPKGTVTKEVAIVLLKRTFDKFK